MHRKSSAVILSLPFILSGLPAAAQDVGPRLQKIIQGNGVTIGGRARIVRGAQGTYINVENPNLPFSIAGFIPFGDEATFPGLFELDGRNVEITGAVVLDGRAVIQMNDRKQLRVARF